MRLELDVTEDRDYVEEEKMTTESKSPVLNGAQERERLTPGRIATGGRIS